MKEIPTELPGLAALLAASTANDKQEQEKYNAKAQSRISNHRRRAVRDRG
jgi:hypothetical protein